MQMKKQMYKTRNNTIKNRYSLLIGLIVFIMFSCNQTGQVNHSSLDNFKFINPNQNYDVIQNYWKFF